MAFDGIVTKTIANELQQLSGARIDKIFQPSKNDLLLGMYINGSNYALNICTESTNCRIHLTTHQKSNPKIAPNFCMVLRKHILGLHLKNIITNNLERLVILEFEGFDDIDDIICKKLVVELMGKHCNIILLDEKNIIIDSLRRINNENSTRAIVPHTKYIYPNSTKHNFMDCLNFMSFKDIINIQYLDCDIVNISKAISDSFNGISKSFIESTVKDLNITKLTDDSLELLYNYIYEIVFTSNTLNLGFKNIYIDTILKDYYLILNNDLSTNSTPFSLNFFIDDFFYNKETVANLRTYKNNISKIILAALKKQEKKLNNINEKLLTCDNMDEYKLYGELITANLYKLKSENTDNIVLNNYYDNNKELYIKLDKKYSPAVNAKLFFKKYNKLKNTLNIVTIQKEETLAELNYIESIIYELENTSTINEISEIFEEISENILIKDNSQKTSNAKKANLKKKSTLTKNKKANFNPLKFTIDGYTLLVGRNNKENDYLTLKYANKTDIWFHTKDIHGSHAILLNTMDRLPNETTLLKCAQISAFYSKAKNSSNVPVDFCEVKYVKKIKGSKPGMVTYTNNRTFFVEPKVIK